MNEPKWCVLLGNDSPNYTRHDGRRSGCQLLAGHAGECTTDYCRDQDEAYIDNGAIAEAEQAENDWRAYQAWIRIAPRRFWDVPQLEDLDLPPTIREQLENWVESEYFTRPAPHGNLVLLGQVGSGKTFTACTIAKREVYFRTTVRIISAVDLLESLRPEGGARIDDYITPRVLLIDDLGIEVPSPWTEERLFGLFDARWRSGDPLIITSNLQPDELRRHLGERVYDRIRDSATTIVIPGPSRRGTSTS